MYIMTKETTKVETPKKVGKKKKQTSPLQLLILQMIDVAHLKQILTHLKKYVSVLLTLKMIDVVEVLHRLG